MVIAGLTAFLSITKILTLKTNLTLHHFWTPKVPDSSSMVLQYTEVSYSEIHSRITDS